MLMTIQTELNLNDRKTRQALRAFLDVLDDAPPEGLDISSGQTVTYDPERVTIWTSTDGAEMVKDEVNLAGHVEADDVVVNTVDQPAKEAEKAKKLAKVKEEVKEVIKDFPEARKVVEAVVNVKTGKGAEVEGTAEEVAEVLDGEKISEDTIVEIRKLQVKLAKYQALDEMKETIREVTGIKKGKLADVPAKFGDELVERLTVIATRLENEGK